MGGLDVRDPIHHIRSMFSSLSIRKSRRNSKDSIRKNNEILKNESASLSSSTLVSTPSIVDIKVDYLKQNYLFSSKECSVSESDRFCQVIYDGEYYNDFKGHNDQLCIVQVENSLFKVHRFVLERDESCFFSKVHARPNPSLLSLREGSPLVVTDTVDQFRDFLRALYSLPKHLPKLEIGENGIRKLPHLLNVAELSHKYSFSSLELWAIEHIFLIIADSAFYLPSPGFTLGHSSTGDLDPDNFITRTLELSLLGNHSELLDILLQKLMTRILWYDFLAGPRLTKLIDKYAPRHSALRRLRGVVNYRRLVDLENTGSFQFPMNHHTQPRFPSSMELETRMKFLAAHQKLTTIWDRLSKYPPPLPSAEGYDAQTAQYRPAASSSHGKCLETWASLWSKAFHRTDAFCSHGTGDSHANLLSHSLSQDSNNDSILFGGPKITSAAVLRKLKRTMLILRKSTAESDSICVECSLGGLEALAMIRDEVIESLDDMFSYTS